MMKSGTRILPLLMFALAVLASGCAVPLPAPELTATAESMEPPPQQPRIGGDVESSSSGAPSSSALSLEQTAGNDDPPSALAPLEADELAGATAIVEEEEATAEPTETPTPGEPTATPEPTGTPEPTVDPSTYPDEVLELLNEIRAEKLIGALQPDATLNASAMAYAEYMASSGFFGHYPPDGSTPAGRIAAAGFGGQYKGEAVSAGQTSPGQTVTNFLNSPDHASILLNPTSVAVGVGYYYDPGSQYGHYWVIVTANP